MRRVAVTGMGIVSPIGDNCSEVMASLKAGKSGISYAEEYHSLGFRSCVYGRPQLDPTKVLDKRTLRFMGEGAAWNYIAMQEAIADAGLGDDEISNPLTGIVMGSGGPSTAAIVAAADITREKAPKRVGPFAVPKAMSSTNSATLAVAFAIKGVNYSISSACATSNHCIINGCDLIRNGQQDIVFAGGGEELSWSLSVLFDAMGALSSGYNDTPATASRAYDANRDGFVISGGAGVLVLEEYERAVKRDAPIYAELVGYGMTSDGYDMVQPSGEGAVRCMSQSLKMARNVVGDDISIDYINPHATSTVIGDVREIEALREVFGSGDNCPPIAATKSLTGHSLGATGVHEAIYSILMMKDNFICQSANIQEVDQQFADMPIVLERLDNQNLRMVMSNSFGFGGTNATLILKKP